MSILVDEDTRVLVQGVTGDAGSFHTEHMLEQGTDVVAGVTPGKAGEEVHGVPVYDTVENAVDNHGIDWSVGFVPAPHAKDAALEAVRNGLHQVVITEHIPVHDTISVMREAAAKGLHVVGPNCPGVLSPGEAKLGIMPRHIFEEGRIGVVSRSGTLTYEIVELLSGNGLGQSTAVGIGGDPVIGHHFTTLLDKFDDDPATDAVVLIGEIGGDLEERAAHHIQENIDIPIVAYIAGRTAPRGKQMGHAGAIIQSSKGTAQAKIDAFKECGVAVADRPSQIPGLLRDWV